MLIYQRLFSWITLSIAIVITLTVIIYPHWLSGDTGQPDHFAAFLLFWAMSAGYVRGVGYIPKRRVFRYLFGIIACITAFAFAICRLNNILL